MGKGFVVFGALGEVSALVGRQIAVARGFEIELNGSGFV